MILDISCSIVPVLNRCSKTITDIVATIIEANHSLIMRFQPSDARDSAYDEPYLKHNIATIAIFSRLNVMLTGKKVVANNIITGNLLSESIFKIPTIY